MVCSNNEPENRWMAFDYIFFLNFRITLTILHQLFFGLEGPFQEQKNELLLIKTGRIRALALYCVRPTPQKSP